MNIIKRNHKTAFRGVEEIIPTRYMVVPGCDCSPGKEGKVQCANTQLQDSRLKYRLAERPLFNHIPVSPYQKRCNQTPLPAFIFFPPQYISPSTTLFPHSFGLMPTSPWNKSSMRQGCFFLFCTLTNLQWLEQCLAHKGHSNVKPNE